MKRNDLFVMEDREYIYIVALMFVNLWVNYLLCTYKETCFTTIEY